MLAEKEEKRRNDDRKKLRERRQVDAKVSLRCFVTVNKAGLTNHTCQKHMLPLKSMCQLCKQIFHQQGFHNHQRDCNKRPRSTYLLGLYHSYHVWQVKWIQPMDKWMVCVCRGGGGGGVATLDAATELSNKKWFTQLKSHFPHQSDHFKEL